jgi:hypothetical protein
MHCREGFDECDSIRFGVLEAGAQVRRLGAVQGGRSLRHLDEAKRNFLHSEGF